MEWTIQSDVPQDELTKYNSALEDLMSSIIARIKENEDFIEQFKDIAQPKIIGAKEIVSDYSDGAIEGNVTYYEIIDLTFGIEDGDIYSLEWNITFKSYGVAGIAYLTSDGRDGQQEVSCSCEGKANITLPDDFRDEFLTGDTIEKIIEDVIPNIKLQVEVHTIHLD